MAVTPEWQATNEFLFTAASAVLRLKLSRHGELMNLTDQHILVVDDDDATRDSVRLMIDRLGYQVTTVDNGKDALKKLEQQPFDLLLSDLYMPGLNGHGLVRAVRDQNTNLPIVVMSGDGDMTDVIELLRTGINDYLQKPFRSGELMQTLRGAFENRKDEASNPTVEATQNTVGGKIQVDLNVRQILRQFREDLRKDNVSLPAPHPVGSQLMALQTQSSVSIDPVVRMLEQSPNIARRVVAISNTSYYRGTRRVSNLKEAAVRLGNRTVLSEAQAIIHRGFFTASNSSVQTLMEELWERTSFQAAFVRELYRLKRLGDPDDAYLATLFHNVGEVVFLKYVDDNVPADMVLNDSDIAHLAEVSRDQHEGVGAALLKHWKFPLSCQALAGCHHQLTAKAGRMTPSVSERQMIHACNIANYVAEEMELPAVLEAECAIAVEDSIEALRVEGGIIELAIQNVTARDTE